MTEAGQSLDPPQVLTLQPGEVIYVETGENTSITGAYRRYVGTSPWTGSAAQLRSAISNAPSSWVSGAGPLMRLVNPTATAGDYRLQAATDGSMDLVNANLAVGSALQNIYFTLETPAALFNPAAAVDNVNSTIVIPGFGANSGDLITIYPDAAFTRTVVVPEFVSVTPAGSITGGNVWKSVDLPAAAIAVNDVVAARYYSVSPQTALVTPGSVPDPVGGLTEGEAVYLRANAETGDVSLFTDAAGTIQRPLNPADTSTIATHYLMVNTQVQEDSKMIRGVNAGQELHLIALGDDRYQLAMDEAQLVGATPRSVLGGQLKEATRLVRIDGTTSQGVVIKNAITADNMAEANTSIGSEAKFNDWLNNRMLTFAKGLAGALWTYMTKAAADSIGQASPATPRPPSTPGSALSGSTAINIASHTASVTQGAGGQIVITGGQPVAISTKINQSFTNKATAETERSGGSLAGSVAIGFTQLDNRAQNSLAGTIRTDGEVKVDSNVLYPNKFLAKFGSADLVREWLSNPFNVSAALSNLTGELVGAGFNSYVQVKNRGKDPADGGTSDRAENALAIGISVSKITNTVTNDFSGSVRSAALKASADTTIDYVRGAGQIHFDVSPERLLSLKVNFRAPIPSGLGTGRKPLLMKNVLSAGNVGKRGIGASISVLIPVNSTQNNFAKTATLNLAGALTATASQGGKSVGVVVGSGSSQDLGVNGGLLIQSGAVNTTENNVNEGARINAASASLRAIDTLSQVDVVGAVQFTNSIGVGLSLIINDQQRRTRNRLDPSGGLVFTEATGLSADALNQGSLFTLAVAGSVRTDQSANIDNKTSLQAYAQDAASFGIAGSGSVVVNKLTANEVSSSLASTSATPAVLRTPAVSLAAKDTTRVQNWGGAIAFGMRGSVVPGAGTPQAIRGQSSIAGSAGINIVDRQVSTDLSGVDLSNTPTAITLSSSTDGAATTAGAISLSAALRADSKC